MMGLMTDMNQVGFYESAEKIIQIPTLLISSLGMVMLPRMSSLYATGKTKEAGEYMKHSIDFGMIISTSLCFGIMGISKEFVPIFYGSGYELCSILYLILLPCCIFLAFSNVIRTQFLIPKGRDTVYISGVVVGAVVNIIINFIFIPSYGAIGAAVGTFFAELSVCIVQILGVKKELTVLSYLWRSIPFLALGLTMFIIIYFINVTSSPFIQMIIKIILGASFYIFGVLLILKVGKNLYGIDFSRIKK